MSDKIRLMVEYDRKKGEYTVTSDDVLLDLKIGSTYDIRKKEGGNKIGQTTLVYRSTKYDLYKNFTISFNNNLNKDYK